MGKIFVLITQLRNLTNRRVGFQFNYSGYCPLPDLPPGKTRKFKQSRILRCGRERATSPWTVLVLVDDSFTGIELCPSVVLDYTRILFRYVTDEDGLEVLRVEGVPENCTDFLLRLKYFGFMRNMVWDSRESVEIPRANSRVAKKLREIEGQAGGEHLAPLIPTLFTRTLCASPTSKPNVDSTTKTPPPPPGTMRDGSEDTSTDTNSDESSSVEESDHKSSTSSNDIGEEVVHSRRVRAQIIRERVSNIHDGRLRGTRREQWGDDHNRRKMDSFEFLILFLIALALIWCVPMFFGGV